MSRHSPNLDKIKTHHPAAFLDRSQRIALYAARAATELPLFAGVSTSFDRRNANEIDRPAPRPKVFKMPASARAKAAERVRRWRERRRSAKSA